MSISEKIGFIGGGNMASAIIVGLLKAGIVDAAQVSISAPSTGTRTKLHQKFPGCYITQSNVEVYKRSDVVILAVKPFLINTVLEEIGGASSNKSFISVAAGFPISAIETVAPNARVIRVMPNTPCSIGEGASAYALGSRSTEEDSILCRTLFQSCGKIKLVKESLMDAVTGVSGSGPAYVYMFIEALADGGVRMGLPRDAALELAAQTVKGAASMVLETGLHPGLLKDQVCSPGGTTIAAVEALEKNGLRNAAISAVVASATRSKEL